MTLVFLCVLFFFFFPDVKGRYGVDLSIPLTSEQWKTVYATSEKSSAFAVVHGVFYNNTINIRALNNIHVLWKEGISDISLYIYPCIPSSQYAKANKIQCGRPKEQIDRLIAALQHLRIAIRRYDYSIVYEDAHYFSNNQSSGFFHDVAFPDYNYDSIPPMYNTSKSNPVIQTIYINVEDNSPNYYFSFQHLDNHLFMADMVSYLESLNIEVGIYTTYRDWPLVMSDRLNRKDVYYTSKTEFLVDNLFRRLKLWTPRYDGVQSFDNLKPFHQWPTIFMKQMSGGTTDLRRIGSSRICTNFIPDNFTLISMDGL